MIKSEDFLKMELIKCEKKLKATKVRYGTLNEEAIAKSATYYGAKDIGNLEGRIELLKLILDLSNEGEFK